jgi:hypothetical protein
VLARVGGYKSGLSPAVVGGGGVWLWGGKEEKGDLWRELKLLECFK